MSAGLAVLSNMHIVSSFFVFCVVIFLVKCEDSCEVNRVYKGTVLTADLIPVTNSSGHQIGTQPIYLQADTTSSVESGSSLYIRCRDPYRFLGNRSRVLAEITCTNGKWIPCPVCLIPSCDKRSLNYGGLDKTGERTFFHDESFEPKCLHGYKVTEKADKRIHCQNGRWTGNLPPCTKEPQCKLPEKPEFGSVELVGNSADVGSVVIFTCDKGRKLIGSVVSTCNSAREWTSPTPRCVAECKTETLLVYQGLLVEHRRTFEDGEWFQPRCDEGFEVVNKDDSKIYCRNGKWEGNDPPCALVEKSSCKTETLLDFEGLLVENRGTLEDGEWFQPRCDEGYEVVNQNESKIYCRDGKWEGSIPPCFEVVKEVRCELPEKPDMGLVELLDEEPIVGSIAIYKCNRGRSLVGFAFSTCDSQGLWTPPAPKCIAHCDTESLVDFDGLIVESGLMLSEGEWFQPQCHEGFEIAKRSDSRMYCRDGEWEGNIPPCSPVEKSHCVLPSVSSGDLGMYEEKTRSTNLGLFFIVMSEGTTLEEDGSVVLKCYDGYFPRGSKNREMSLFCRDGKLSPEPNCVITQCNIESISHFEGLAVESVRMLNHGEWFQPRCGEGFEIANNSYSKIYCRDGNWEGSMPPCSPVQESYCEVPSVPNGYLGQVEERYRGGRRRRIFIKMSVGTTLEEDGSVLLKCQNGYFPKGSKTTEMTLYCVNGKLSPEPKCAIRGEPCETEYLLGFPGVVLSTSDMVEDGQWIEPICADGYEILGRNVTKLYCDNGRWEGTLPSCYPAPCLENPPVPENGRVKPTWWKIDHGATVEYECFRNYAMTEAGNVECSFGKWIGSLPTCTDKKCYLINLLHKEGVDLSEDEPVQNFMKANIVCIEGFDLKYPDVRCVNGQWQTQNDLSPCQESQCRVISVENGEILKEKSIPTKNSRGSVTGTSTVYEQAEIGSFESNGATLYASCRDPYRFRGVDEELNVITCQRGQWIPTPQCIKGARCSMESLLILLPENVVTRTDIAPDSNVPTGLVVKLGCGRFQMAFQGNSNAICQEDGTWNVGSNILCSHGCKPLQKTSDSKLIISPDKTFYEFGDSITLLCPEGMSLSEDVERIVCLSYGWAPNTIPFCK